MEVALHNRYSCIRARGKRTSYRRGRRPAAARSRDHAARCQPLSLAYKRSASPLAVSSTSSDLPASRALALGRGQQGGADTLVPRPSPHQHFRNVGAVRLILSLREDDLHACRRSARAAFSAANRIRSRRARYRPPRCAKTPRPYARAMGNTETHRGAAFDAIDEHVAQLFDFPLSHGLQGSNLNGVWHSLCVPFAHAEVRATSQNTAPLLSIEDPSYLVPRIRPLD